MPDIAAKKYLVRLYRGSRMLRETKALLDPRNDDLVKAMFVDEVDAHLHGGRNMDYSPFELRIVDLNGGRWYVKVGITRTGEWVIKR